MFKMLVVVAIHLTLIVSPSAMARELVVPARQCACDPQTSDALEDPSQFNFGAFSGQCVDSCRFRKSKYFRKGKTVSVSNFMHEGKYWLARIPIEHVESAQVGFEEFLPGIYHVFLIFHFSEKNPVVLTSQDQETAKSQKIFNMVISAEGIPPKEGKYNLMDAYMERYIIGLRLMSKEQVIDWSVKKLKHPISLYDLKLDQGQVRKVLLTGLSTGEKNSFQVKYGLFSNNCATNTLDLIDTVVTPEIAGFPIYYKLIYPLARSLPVAGPLGTYHAFWSRDLIQKHPNSVL